MLAIAEKKINRRSFLSGITAFSTLALADTKVPDYVTENLHYMNKPKKPLWIDTHNHVSDIMSNGQKNDKMLEDLLNVLDRCDADLKLIISTDGKYVNQMM